MTKNVWYPRYPGDYAKKTAHLSLAEHGAYTLLLDHCYSNGGRIPANAEQVHRICRAFGEDEQEACRTVLQEFFIKGDDGYRNDRADRELLRRGEISEKRSKAAIKRHASAGANGDANADANAHTVTVTVTDTVKEEERAKALLSSEDCGPDLIEVAFSDYNAAAQVSGWPHAQALNPKRKAALRGRMKEAGGIEGWRFALAKAKESDFLCGRRPTRDGPFFASLDFLLQQSSFTKLMEGSYDNRRSAAGQNIKPSRADVDRAILDAAKSLPPDYFSNPNYSDL